MPPDTPPPPPPTPPSNSGQSVRSKKTPLPKYTSIDLENDLPQMYNTALNPNLHDPDMTIFFNRNAQFYGKRNSPPPSYYSQPSNSATSARSSTSSTTPTKSTRRSIYITIIACFFLILPMAILIVLYILPEILNDQHRYL